MNGAHDDAIAELVAAVAYPIKKGEANSEAEAEMHTVRRFAEQLSLALQAVEE